LLLINQNLFIMKKLFLVFGLMIGSLVTFAQLPTFGIRGGVNFANLLISAEGSNLSVSTGSLTTYSFGIFADFRSGNTSFQPAINYTGKGGSITGDGGTSGKFNLHYLQVPLNVVFHAPALVGDLYFGAGPYIAMGLSGTATGSDGTTTESDKVTFGGTNGDFESTDIGIDGIAGLKLKSGFLVHVNYDFGLTNILNSSNPNNTGGGQIKTRTFGISVGYAF